MKAKFTTLILLIIVVGSVLGQTDFEGFHPVNSELGVVLYKHNTLEIYVQKINLNMGAKINLLYGTTTDKGDIGLWGLDGNKPNPTFQRYSIDEFWQQLKYIDANAFSVCNASFYGFANLFDSDDDSSIENKVNKLMNDLQETINHDAYLSFPLKVDNIVSSGFDSGYNRYGDLRVIKISSDGVYIEDLSNNNFEVDWSSYPQQCIVGYAYGAFTNEGNVVRSDKTMRTLFGVKNNNEVYILVSEENITLDYAEKVLVEDFEINTNQIVIFDGGGSSKLIGLDEESKPYNFVRGNYGVIDAIDFSYVDLIKFGLSPTKDFESYLSDLIDLTSIFDATRKIPQSIGVIAGKPNYNLSLFSETVLPLTTSPGLSINAQCSLKLENFEENNEYDIYLGVYLSKDDILDNSDIYLGYSIEKIGNYNTTFEKNLTIPSNTETGDWNVLFVPFVSENLQETITIDDIGKKAITIEANTNTEPQKSDILITEFSIEEVNGSTVSTKAVLNNCGDMFTEKNFLIHYYISQNPTFEATDIYLGYENISPILANESSIVTKSLSVPDNIVSGGYYLIAIADATNEIDEINENNNNKAVIFTNGATTSNSKPDLAVINPYSLPITPEVGSSIIARCIIQNQGQLSTNKDFSLQFYLSEDRIFDGTDISLSTTTVSTLGAGETIEVEHEMTLPGNIESGNYYIYYKVDVNGEIDESNENNNTAYDPVIIKENVPDVIDLLLEVAEVNPAIVKLGEFTTQFRSRIRNIGNISSAACNIAYYLSTDATLDENDTYLQQDAISAIYPNYTYINETDITLPNTLTEGIYYIIFIADNGETVTESDETNNIVSRSFEIKDYISSGELGTYSDLILENVVFDKETVFPGENIKVNFTIKNSGDLGTVASSRVGYYISTNDAVWDDQDILIATNYFGSILPDGTVDIERTFPLPANLSQGDASIIVYIDYQQKVAESDRINNTFTQTISVTYDEQMTVFTPNIETSWSRNRNHTITWASNVGGTVKIELYKGVAVEKVIASAASNNGSYTWFFPEDLYPADHYRVLITSNSDNSVNDFSDYFNVVYEDYVEVLEPITGAEFGQNTTRIIKWETAALGGVDFVDIHLYKGGTFYQEIDNFVTTVKTYPTFYEWKIPDDIAIGDDYTIKVINSNDIATFDFSPQFSIKASELITTVAVDDIASTIKNQELLIAALDNDNAPDGETLNITAVSQPTNGSTSINTGNQSITYVPNNDYVGSDYFTYTVNSASGENTASIYIDVMEESTNPETWLISAGGSGIDNVVGIAVDNNGNSYITGTFDNATFGTTTLTGTGTFIAKFKSDGTFEWVQKIEAGTYGRTYDVDVDNVGNVYVVGSFTSTINFYEGSTINHTYNAVHDSEVFFAKYNPTGTIIWAKVGRGISEDYGYSIAVEKSSGEFAISGICSYDITFGEGGSAISLSTIDNKSKSFIVKYNKDAVPYWAKKVEGSKSNFGEAIAIDNNGDVILSGYFRVDAIFSGATDITLTNADTEYMYIAKFNSADGNVQWAQKTAGFTYSTSNGRAVVCDEENNIFVTGRFNYSISFYDSDAEIFSITTEQHTNVYVAKYSANGMPLWAKIAIGDNSIYSNDISLVNNNPVLTGQFTNSFMFGSGDDTVTISNEESTSAFVWVLNNSTGNNINVFSINCTGNSIGKGIAGDAQGNIYMTGTYANSLNLNDFVENIEVSSVVNSTDVFIAKIVELKTEFQEENFTPSAIDDIAYTPVNTSVQISPLINDSDLNGDIIDILNFTQPENGIVTKSSDVFNYVPESNFSGIDKFSYTITDGNEATASANVEVFVISINAAPTLEKIPDQTIQIGGQFNVIDLNKYVYDDYTENDSIIWSIEGDSNLSISIDSGLASVSCKNVSWTGNETISFIATDGEGLSQNTNATFAVIDILNETPIIIQIPDQTINEGELFTEILLDNHILDDHTSKEDIVWTVVNGDNLTVSIADRVASISLNDNTWAGSENVTFIAQDEGNLANSQIVTFAIGNVNAIAEILSTSISIYPNPNNGTFTISSDYLANKSSIIDILDVNGLIISTMEVDNKPSVNFNLHLNNGLYFVRIKAGNNTLIKKIIINDI